MSMDAGGIGGGSGSWSGKSLGGGGSSGSYSRVGPSMGGWGSFLYDGSDAISKKALEDLEKLKKRMNVQPDGSYAGKRNGFMGSTISRPGQQPLIGSWQGWDREGDDPDPEDGFFSFREAPRTDPFYDPTLPPGWKGAATPPQQQKMNLDIEALLALIGAGGGQSSARRSPMGSTRYINSIPSYSNFLGRG